MHISEPRRCSDAAVLTTGCARMTEERRRTNGCCEGAEAPRAQGGRLKFFKDGKFILELERAREGERVAWVSVPRKTFWPPQGTAAATYRQESSASLSVSDDNSSIQSSPWQRDHSWKQTTPRRHQSKELAFFYNRPWQQRRRRVPRKYLRAPHCIISEEESFISGGTHPASERTPKKGLLVVVQCLVEKAAAVQRSDVVSPRKRFLREMEKDKAQVEDSYQKRSRSKPLQNNNNNNNKVASPNGFAATTPPPETKSLTVTPSIPTTTATTPRSCSYSITSLLAEDRGGSMTSKRSPSNSPSQYSTAQAQYCSPTSTPATSSSEDRWYSESVDRLRSIELSQADKRGFSTYPHPSYLPPYMYPYTLPPYYGPGVYGRAYMMPPMYHPHAHTHAPPVRLSMRGQELPRLPSCSWTAEPPRDLEHRDDNITDMPLNLSKHAG